MSRSLPRRRRAASVPVWLALAALTSVAWACSDGATPTSPILEPAASQLDDIELQGRTTRSALEVFTQNVYLGGDTGPLFAIDLGDLSAVLQATNLFWSQVQTSDVPGRIAAIVDEIERRRPEVVGLQEVVRFVILDPSTGQVLDGIDLLAALQAEIAARGLPYEAIGVQEATSGALPLAVGAGGITQVLSFTDRVVALRRTDVVVTGSAGGTYQAAASLGPITLKRGWIRVSFEHDGVPVHFVTTQLEVQSLAPVQAGQVDELMTSVLAGLDGVTILAGDLNSDAAASPGSPSWTPTYDLLTSAGFTDAWSRAQHDGLEEGFTCCQDPDLRNEESELDQRIDFVLVRGSEDGRDDGGFAPGSIAVDVTADEPSDRVEGSGLWPSDHAGLAAGMRLFGSSRP